ILACLAANLISFYRWQLLVQALDVPFKLVDAVRIGFIGAFFGLVAFGVVAGDSLRAFYATRHVKNRTPEAITSVLVDRLIGLMTMFTIATIAFLLFDPAALGEQHAQEIRVLELIGWFVVGCTACGYVGMTVLFFTPQLSKTKLFKRIIGLPKVGPIIEKLSGAISLYRDRLPTIGVAFLLSVGVNLCFVTAIYSLAIGLTENNPSFADHFVIEPIAMVSNAVPLPGGIGGMEFAMQYLYIAFGSSNGVVAGFAMRFSLLLVHAIGGFLWFQNREQVADIEKQAVE
ncbi:flippase-like domain-containing protein, partial [Mariniblastus sp.]|nr:flippase-like domain-containing protein [Mariniblastus sp.]